VNQEVSHILLELDGFCLGLLTFTAKLGGFCFEVNMVLDVINLICYDFSVSVRNFEAKFFALCSEKAFTLFTILPNQVHILYR